jgi:hypothetical protein
VSAGFSLIILTVAFFLGGDNMQYAEFMLPCYWVHSSNVSPISIRYAEVEVQGAGTVSCMINSKLMATDPEERYDSHVDCLTKATLFRCQDDVLLKPCPCLVVADLDHQGSHGVLRFAICKATTPVYPIGIVSSPDIKIKCYLFLRQNDDHSSASFPKPKNRTMQSFKQCSTIPYEYGCEVCQALKIKLETPQCA